MDWLEPYRRMLDAHGRSSRSEYWLFQLVGIALTGVAVWCWMQLTGGDEEPSTTAGFVLVCILALGYVLPNLMLTVRRLHDQDVTGWAVLIGTIPYLGPIVLLVMMFRDGTPGPNR